MTDHKEGMKDLIPDFKMDDLEYIVERWEQDSLDISNNQHLLFVFKDKRGIDFFVDDTNLEEINVFLLRIGSHTNMDLEIRLEFHIDFFDRIIYPEHLAGEPYYEPKYQGLVYRILKFFGYIPLKARF